MGMLDYPVFVVTTQADGRPSGCLVSLTSQTSVQPPSFLVSIPRSNPTCEVVIACEYVAVHVLARSNQVLAKLFLSQTSDEDERDKFERCSWRSGPAGMPILDDAVAWFVGRMASWTEVGDHVAYLLEPVAVWAPECTEDLLYLSDIDDLEPGQESDSAVSPFRPRDEPRRYGVPRFTLDGF
ncbi:flavin reductase family protein [Mycobacterium spongiae]|uniref:Flavin reductase family protein n=2 Tax=Mycobacterium spongiae TaxID=886343 RepID=A0A975K1H6_9MYCO|nr:flavin reductase family protein [Mycobacterium spongiae]